MSARRPRWLTGLPTLALGLALAVALGGCDHCRTHQVFVLESPDSELQALVDDCVANRDACLPLCNRVLEISGLSPWMPSIETCFYGPPYTPRPDAGARAFGSVTVVYREPSCS